MTDDRKIRLCRVGPEALADAILILADQYEEADKLVECLLAPADSAEARIKGELFTWSLQQGRN